MTVLKRRKKVEKVESAKKVIRRKTPPPVDLPKDPPADTRTFDKTQLKLAQFKYQPHKDYLGHIFRWGFASRFVNNKVKVLDVGCGQEMPFARSLGGSSISTIPKGYVGVDLNKIKDPVVRKWSTVHDEFNFIDNYRKLVKQHGLFDLVVNFEVYEHMQHASGAKLLKAMAKSLDHDGKLIFSTPVFCSSYGMAKNHINEVTKAVIEKELDKAGFKIIAQHGTFCNMNDIKKVASKSELALYTRLAEFYGNEVLGCFLSAKYPEASRNITHICVLKSNEQYPACELVDSIVKAE